MVTDAAGAEAPLTMRPVGELLDHIGQVVQDDVDVSLIERALTHRSYAYEHGGVPHNERLEFLGDAVLGVIITDTLYTSHPDHTEGQLAKYRAAVVNMRALADAARVIGLGDFVFLGRGEETTGGRDKDSILADTTEAVIGAIYLATGLSGAARFVHHLLDPVLAATASLGAGLDWKTSLQEIAAELGLGAPEYRVTEDGPEHAKLFTAQALVGGEVHGQGRGRTKKDAEQKAAATAWKTLSPETDGESEADDGAVDPAADDLVEQTQPETDTTLAVADD